MKRGGKTSRAEIETTNLVVIDSGKKRPQAPEDLTDEQKALWRRVVDDEPLDQFSTEATQGMLKDYILQRYEADRITLTINAFPSEGMRNKNGIKHYENLIRVRDRCIGRASSLATKLRLTNQSRYTALSSATASRTTLRGEKPWQWD
jgi:hypothetical protein